MRLRTPVVAALAVALSGGGDSLALTLLADALEESGCDNSGVVAHLRSTAKHYRGCHVLDAILGLS